MKYALIILINGLIFSGAMAMDCRDALHSPSVIAFTSNTCAQCQTDKAELHKLAAQGVQIEIVNVDERPDVANFYGVTHTPDYLVVQDGQIIHRTHSVQGLGSFLLMLLAWIVL